jgi:putative inorganic carbon (HCO3(-)) transporter
MVAAANAVLIAGIAWGAFAFGAVYPWGYYPLAMAAAAVGLTGLLVRPSLRRVVPPYLSAAVVLFIACGALQLVPLPAPLVDRVSPEASRVQAQYLLGASTGSSRQLSISPSDSRRGLTLFAAMALLAIGASSLVAITGASRICAAITVIGSALAITGIVQKAMYNGKLLGFWTTLQGGTPYGPFVNRNHFAGWMLMAVPLSAGLLCAMLSRHMHGVTRSRRDWLLWLSSPGASLIILLAAGVALMGLSIVLALSRSGITSAACAMVVAMVAARRAYPRAQALAVIATLTLVTVLIVSWAGVDQIVERFSALDLHDLNGRLWPWRDALGLASRYPLSGTGLNTYGVAMLFYQRFNLVEHYSAAHNDYLQLLAEGGVLLTVPAVVATGLLVAFIRKRFKEETSRSTFWIRAGATMALLAIAIQELVDFSLQIPGNAFLFAIVCAIAIHQTPERRRA